MMKSDVTIILWRTNNHEIAIDSPSEDDMTMWLNIIAKMPIGKAFEHLPDTQQGEWLQKILTSSMVRSYTIINERENKND